MVAATGSIDEASLNERSVWVPDEQGSAEFSVVETYKGQHGTKTSRIDRECLMMEKEKEEHGKRICKVMRGK